MDRRELSQPDFRKICENLYDGIHITDGTGTVLFVNRAYTRTTGLRPEEILGKKVSDLENREKLYKGSVTDLVLKRRKRVDALSTITGNGKSVLVTGVPVFGDTGEVELVVTSTRDFPELKHLEQQLLSLAAERQKANEELAFLRQQQMGRRRLSSRGGAMAATMDLIRTVAPTDATVLISGESGTGKELVANELYRSSGRAGKPFIKINCAAIPAELLESELFGYEEGAFTGARRAGKPGMFELANSGVILLDEIGDMPLPLQSKLLRVLQQKELVRIGGSRTVKLDIRIIASTNKDLLAAVRQGTFREDLYYRLNVVPIELKALRDRTEEIPFLAEEFCGNFNKKYGKAVRIAPDGIRALTEYSWPGNIRELENLVERMVVTSCEATITRENISAALNFGGALPSPEAEQAGTLKHQVAAFEREVILRAVRREGSIRKAAKALGVDHSTLVKKCRQYPAQESGD